MYNVDIVEVQQSILKTILYSDIFSFPLTKTEIWKYLKSSKKIPKRAFNRVFEQSLPGVENRDGYFFLSSRQNLTQIRATRKHISTNKLLIAQMTASLLAKIPSVLLVGISGSLAAGNAKEEDDIDIFIITKHKTLWLSRLLILGLLSVRGIRRKRNAANTKDLVCVNMLLDEKHLSLPDERKDVYTAHEIAQLIPLVNKHHTYEQFLKANLWIINFLPNSITYKTIKKKSLTKTNPPHPLIRIVEVIAARLQLWHINKVKTNETVTSSLLAFHPDDPRRKVLHAYKKRLKLYRLDYE